ncbi:MAG: glycosyltransferase [Haliea sp.]|uniref:glycosyltransferase n=1 Tax=Haliea sp. TaxID=1932666 RepID=UPI0032ECC721
MNCPPLCLVAFSGEAGQLARALEALPPGPQRETMVLCSADSELERLAAAAGVRCLPSLPAAATPGRYWCLVSAALSGVVGRCIVLRAGNVPGSDWHRRFPAREEGAAAVFPLAVRHPETSVFSSPEHTPCLSVEDIDRWLNIYAPGTVFDIPFFAGESALIDVERLGGVAATDDLELAQRVRECGGLILATDNVYIDDRVAPPQSLPAATFPAWQTAIARRHPLTGLRHALTELSSRAESPGADIPQVLPARLHISHSWGGGLGRWVEDFVAADGGHRSFVLRPIGDLTAFGQTLALYSARNLTVPIRTWTLAQPILSTAIAHYEYRQLVAGILAEFAIGSVILSSLIGHALDILRLDLPVIVVCHDFYPFCPPILATWETPCSQCDNVRLTDCLQNNPGHRFFHYEQAPHWLALRAAFTSTVTERSIALVAPSASVAARMHSLIPALREDAIQVIAHGLSQAFLGGLAAVACPPAPQHKLRIVVLGSLEMHKGAQLLQAVIEPLAEFATVVLVGSGEGGNAFAGLPHVQVSDGYSREELGALLAAAQPDIGLLLSVVPETFSYTLSELHAAGIPVAATALGAFADRIRHGDNGWLYPPAADALLVLLRSLAANPEEVARVRAVVTATTPRTATAMVADYDRLFPPADGPLLRPVETDSARSGAGSRNIKINPEAKFRDVFREFWDYARRKVHNTEKLPRGLARLLLWLMKVLYR